MPWTPIAYAGLAPRAKGGLLAALSADTAARAVPREGKGDAPRVVHAGAVLEGRQLHRIRRSCRSCIAGTPTGRQDALNARHLGFCVRRTG